MLLPLHGLEPSSESSITVTLPLLDVDQVVFTYYLETIVPFMCFDYSSCRKYVGIREPEQIGKQ